jgi:hypothetical protein
MNKDSFKKILDKGFCKEGITFDSKFKTAIRAFRKVGLDADGAYVSNNKIDTCYIWAREASGYTMVAIMRYEKFSEYGEDPIVHEDFMLGYKLSYNYHLSRWKAETSHVVQEIEREYTLTRDIFN